MNTENTGFRFGLKTMLFVFLVLGVGGGILGSLFLRNPQVFFAVWSIGSIVVPFVLAILTILWLCRSMAKKRGVFIWTGMLTLAPLVGLGLLPLFQYLHMQGVTVATPNNRAAVGQYSNVATDDLLANYLPAEINTPWVWNELEDRLQANNLSKAEIDEAITLLTNSLKQDKDSWKSPLNWQDTFITSTANKMSKSVYIDLHDAYFGPARLELGRLRDSETGFDFRVKNGSTWADNSGLNYKLLWNIKAVELDGKPISWKQNFKTTEELNAACKGVLSPGEHELKILVDCAYVQDDKLVGLRSARLKTEDWPTPAKEWEQEIVRPIHVHTKDEELVKLAASKELDPTREISCELIVQQESGKKKLIARFKFEPDTPIACSFLASAYIESKEIKLGRVYRFTRESGSTSSSGTEITKPIASIPDDVKHADILLTPNPKAVEQYAGVSQIWGKKVLDLDRKPSSDE